MTVWELNWPENDPRELTTRATGRQQVTDWYSKFWLTSWGANHTDYMLGILSRPIPGPSPPGDTDGVNVNTNAFGERRGRCLDTFIIIIIKAQHPQHTVPLIVASCLPWRSSPPVINQSPQKLRHLLNKFTAIYTLYLRGRTICQEFPFNVSSNNRFQKIPFVDSIHKVTGQALNYNWRRWALARLKFRFVATGERGELKHHLCDCVFGQPQSECELHDQIGKNERYSTVG